MRIIFLSVMLLTGSVFAKDQTKNTLMSHCQHKINEELCATVNFLGPISRKQDAKFELQFVSNTGKNLVKLKKDPQVKLWMVMKNGHEHGSDKVELSPKDKGYLVSNVWFLMLGQWQLKLKGEYQGKEFSVELPVCVKKDPKQSALGSCQ